ncbi:retrovirus-related pol polyprotein from transposon TNT 1-94 [Tanacetum coccineum]
MTRSSTTKLFTPFGNPEREFRTSRKLFKTPGLDESSSPEFDLFFDLEENYEEEVIETMAETMEQYMIKTQADYGSGVTRPKIDDNYHFELKGQFLKELRDNTFGGSDHEDANEYIEKVIPTRQILDSKGAIPTKTVADAKVAIQKMAKYSQKWHNGTSRTRSTKTSDGLAAIQAQLNNLGREIKKVNKKVYAAQGSGSLPSSTETNLRDHVNSISNTVEADTTPIRHIGSTRYAVSVQQNSKLIFEPRQATVTFPSRLYDDYSDERKGSYGLKDLDGYSIGTTLRDDSLPKKEKNPGSFTLPCYINNVCFEKALDDLGASVSVMPLSTYLNLGLGELAHTKLIVELADRTVKHPKGIAKNVLVGIGKFVFPIDFIILDMPEDVNMPLILERPFLSTTHAK